MREKKIAMVSTGFAPIPAVNGGGVETLATTLLEENQNSRIQIDVYTIYDKKLDHCTIKNTKIISIKPSKLESLIKFIYRVVNRLLKIFHIDRSYGEFDRRLANAVLKQKYEKIIVENNMNIFRLIAKKDNDTPLVYHLHNSIWHDPSKNSNWVRLLVKRAYKILTVSQFIKKQVDEFDATQTEVLYNCVDTNKFYPIESVNEIRNEYHISDDDFVVLYCGRLSEEKGAAKVYEALRIAKEKGHSFKLVIAGKSWFNSFAEKQFEKKLAELSEGCNDEIIQLGYVPNENMPAIYSMADLTVVSSLCDEAFGLTALESLLCGTPVIASNRGGLPEVVSNDVGYVVDTNERMASEIEKIIYVLKSDHKLYKKMANNTRSYALNKFGTAKEYYEKFINIIK